MDTIKYCPYKEVCLDEKSTVTIPIWLKALFVIYIFLSYFEIYFVPFLGSNTKFLMIGIIILLFIVYRGKLKINSYSIMFILWFTSRCISILWSSGANDSVSVHIESQIGIVLFLVLLCGQNQDKAFLRLILKAYYWFSFLFGILSIFLRRSYISEIYSSRQVLTLFGQQNDPNNCAAFLIVGIAMATCSIIYERKHIILNLLVIAVNSYATLLTASRAGLLSIGILVVLLLLLPSKDEKVDIWRSFKKIFILVFTIAAIIFLAYRFLPEASLNRLLAFDDYASGSGRSIKWEYAIELFKQRPLFGWGWGGFSYGSIGSLHNTFLTLLCEGGIVGLSLFTLPIIIMLIYALQKRRILIIVLLFCGLFPSFFIDAINKRFLWNAILISLLLINYDQESGELVSIWDIKRNDQRGMKQMV